MGYHLCIKNENNTISWLGSSLYGKLNGKEYKLKSFKFLVKSGVLNQIEDFKKFEMFCEDKKYTLCQCWGYGFSYKVIITPKIFNKFIELYLIDCFKNKIYIFDNIETLW